MSFDTFMAGSPESVECAASWLRFLESTMRQVEDNTRGVRGLSDQIWQGQGGDAYRDFNLDLQKCLDELSGRAARTAETFLSYAQQLRYRQEDMASYRARANAGGLPVVGTVIHPAPVVARPEPPSGAAAESEKLDYWGRVSEYQSYLRSIDLYATLQNRAHGTFERLDKWVADNLVDSEADLQVPGLTAAMGLAAPVVNYALDFGSTAYDHRAEQLVEQAQRHAVESAARASGNPEVRAGYLPPRELVVERRLTRSGTMAAAERFGRVGRVGRVLGTVVTGADRVGI